MKYLYQNHGLPYFQMRIPQELQDRFDGKTKLSIALKPQDGPPVIQVQRLAKKYKALFRAFREEEIKLCDQGANMQNYKIVGYLLTYRYPEYSGLTHLDRFDTLAKAEDYAESSELTEYVINPIVDLSGD